jgi:hypothetical protein
MAANEYNVGTSTAVFDNYTTFTVALSGCTASSVIGYCELIINYEWTPAVNTSYSALVSEAALSLPAVMEARANTSRVLDTIQNVKSNVEFGTNVMKTVMDLGRSASSMMSTARVGMSMLALM